MKPRTAIAYLSVCTALSTLGLWVCFQRIAPLIGEAAATLGEIPNLCALLVFGCMITYIFKGVQDV